MLKLIMLIFLFALAIGFACGYGVREWISHRRRKEARKDFASRTGELSALETRIANTTSEIKALRDEARSEFAAVRSLLDRKSEVTDPSERTVAASLSLRRTVTNQ
jgi:hypothetical protein